MFYREVALIIFYNEDNEILLQGRAGISKVGEKWGFFGGGLEDNETPEEAVIRETEEELGYDLKEFEYIGNCKNTHNERTIDRHVFISPLKDKMSEFTLKEGGSMRLFSIERAKKLDMIPGDKEVLEMVKDQL